MSGRALPPARAVLRLGNWSGAYDVVVLGYDERFLRRKRLVTAQGEGFLVDLPETVSLNHGDALQLDDGRLIEVIAADESLVEVLGDLPRLAWHIGNRHTPCQIEPHNGSGRLLIRRDPVLEAMLQQLGAHMHHVVEPFTPEGGAYGMGRTMGHDHGANDHGAHDHGHAHVHHHGAHHHIDDDEAEAEAE